MLADQRCMIGFCFVMVRMHFFPHATMSTKMLLFQHRGRATPSVL